MIRQQSKRHCALRSLSGALAAAGLAIGCASPYPAVLSSTYEAVAIEFEINGSLQEASALAHEECQKHGRNAEFVKVDKIATPDTRVSKYRCIEPEAPAQPAAPTDAAPEEMPGDAEQSATPEAATE
jgi:hypothetical protein